MGKIYCMHFFVRYTSLPRGAVGWYVVSDCGISQSNSLVFTVEPVLSGRSKRRPKIGFQDQLSLNECQSIAECSKSILQ